MKKLNLVFGLVFIISSLQSQELSRQLISAGGSSSTKGMMVLDWSLGQITSATVATSDGVLTQGFQQPNISKKVPVFSNDLIASDFLEVWPNPTSNFLFIEIRNAGDRNLYFDLLDNQGAKIHGLSIESTSDKVTFNLEKLLPGLYILMIYDHDGELLQSKKIIRSN